MLAMGLAILTTLAASANAHDFKTGTIEIKHPWSKAAPPVAPVLGGYVTIVNTGTEPDRLLGGSSAIAERLEIHESKTENGVAKMRPLKDGLIIGPGETVKLEPDGSAHIMFLKPSKRPAAGEKFPGTLVFEKAGVVNVEFAVQAMGEQPQKAEDHQGHKN
ncbi:copper chaperone PCu(A)C [Rhizobium leguminosarum]|nr:copper chaperone PCu(A)C [Rhizobium leguminosarum]NKM04523.1 copper chaperone PCu(A)C [Rhizobium leguminosarum bv. viciae]